MLTGSNFISPKNACWLHNFVTSRFCDSTVMQCLHLKNGKLVKKSHCIDLRSLKATEPAVFFSKNVKGYFKGLDVNSIYF